MEWACTQAGARLSCVNQKTAHVVAAQAAAWRRHRSKVPERKGDQTSVKLEPNASYTLDLFTPQTNNQRSIKHGKTRQQPENRPPSSYQVDNAYPARTTYRCTAPVQQSDLGDAIGFIGVHTFKETSSGSSVLGSAFSVEPGDQWAPTLLVSRLMP